MAILKEKPKPITISIFIAILLLSVAIIFLYNTYKNMSYKLPDNIWINETNLGSKNLVEAQRIVNELVEEQLNREVSIILNYENNYQEHKFSLNELGFKSNKEEIKKNIISLLRNDSSILSKFKSYYDIKFSGKYLSLKYEIDPNTFLRALQKFDESNFPKPQNAIYEYREGNLNIIGEIIGYEFDKERLYNDLKDDFKKSTISFYLKELKPEITYKTLEEQGMNEKISTYSTKFDSSNSPRVHNIKLASENINGTILSPGEVFSFNNIVGERTKERDFKEAGVYVNGKVSEGLGGGICQVSTTLYNAVLYSDLEIVERSNHSLTVPYVPLSRDATVSWGYKDLKFKNNTDNYIYIGSKVEGNKLTFDLFGTKDNRRVELISTVISKQSPPVVYEEDTTLQSNEQIVIASGHNGYVSSLTKKVYKNGELISSEVISKDRYLTTPRIIKKNVLDENAEE